MAPTVYVVVEPGGTRARMRSRDRRYRDGCTLTADWTRIQLVHDYKQVCRALRLPVPYVVVLEVLLGGGGAPEKIAS